MEDREYEVQYCVRETDQKHVFQAQIIGLSDSHDLGGAEGGYVETFSSRQSTEGLYIWNQHVSAAKLFSSVIGGTVHNVSDI